MTATIPSFLEKSELTAFPKKNTYSVAYLIFLYSVLMFGVLAFGAVETWATSILEISSALLFTAVVVHDIFISGSAKWNPLYQPILAFAAVMSIQLLFNLTAYRYATLVVFVEYIAYGMLFYVATQTAGDERSSKSVLLAFSIFGAGVALFAICQNLSSSPNIYWLRPPDTDASIFGPYINHDHYAGLMELLTPLALVLSLSGLVQGAQRLLVAFGGIIMAGSILLSLSRGGAISVIAEILALLWILRKSPGGQFTGVRILALIVTIMGFLAFIGSPAMWRHLGHLQDALRLDILKDALKMFIQRPLMGWGLGAFPTAYPAFRSFYTAFYINAAHNDYVQALVETGIVGFICNAWFIVVLYRQGLTHLEDWTRSWNGTLRIATLVGCTGLLVHSAFDFNLQIPANAALFYVFCAFASSLPVDGSNRVRTRVRTGSSRSSREVSGCMWQPVRKAQ